MYILKLYNKIIFSENNFRNILVELERENVSLRYCNSEQKKMVHNYIDNITWKNNNALCYRFTCYNNTHLFNIC